MKKYFITGLILLLPLVLTLAIIIFIFNLLTEPFAGILKNLFNRYGILQDGLGFFTSDQIQQYVSQILILAILFFFTVFLGLIGRWFFIHYFIRFWEHFFHRIPFISAIYKTCNDVIKTIFATETKSFKQVVMVRFPNPETFSLGLITREEMPPLGDKDPTVSVFVPTTPNPTSGFLIMYKRSELVYLDMKVEEAFKYVISCGMIVSPFREAPKYNSIQENSE